MYNSTIVVFTLHNHVFVWPSRNNFTVIKLKICVFICFLIPNLIPNLKTLGSQIKNFSLLNLIRFMHLLNMINRAKSIYIIRRLNRGIFMFQATVL